MVKYFRFQLGFEYRDIRQGLRDMGKRFLELGEKLGEKLECQEKTENGPRLSEFSDQTSRICVTLFRAGFAHAQNTLE